MPDAAAMGAALVRIGQLLQSGDLPAAETACRELLSAAPDQAAAWRQLAQILLRREAPFEAEDALRQALALQDDDAALWSELGHLLHSRGRGNEAEECARQAVALQPANSAYWSELARAHYSQQQWPEAAAAYRQALLRDDRSAAAWNNLGTAELKLGNLAAAEEALERALALAPTNVGAIANYAYLLCCAGRRPEASAFVQQRMGLDLQTVEGWMVLGKLWEAMAEWELAAAAYQQAVGLSPRHIAARYELARMLRSGRRLSAAEEVTRELLRDAPQHADAWALLGEVVSSQGWTAEGTPMLRRAVEMAPDLDRHARYLTGLQYDETTPGELLAAHRQWDAAYARNLLPAAPVRPVGASPSQLRIGFLSADFGRHPIGFLALPALERMDQSRCAIVCYSDRASDDEYTARFRKAASAWRTIVGLSDADIAAQIKRDQIDVLIDLMGHTGKRLLVFARRPAALQVTWLGYVGTTGMAAIDCLLADRFHVREGEEPWYSESVLRMPHGYACYGPPADAPEVCPLPARATGHVTLGCFNNPAKYSSRLFDAWGAILRKLPTAQLLLKSGGLDDPRVQAHFRGELARRGVSGERILLEGWSETLLANYHRVDLALDTQPYSGGLTTCEALWMGVPVVTCPGPTFAGRHSTSHLMNAGLAQFVASDLAGYVELAVQWGSQLDELAALRSQLREQMRRSPLCDAPRFADDLLTLLRQGWESAAKRG